MIQIPRNFIAALILLTGQLPAIELPAGGTEISSGASLNASISDKVGRAEKITAAEGRPGGWRMAVTVADSSKPYLAQCAVSCPTGTLATGDRALVITEKNSWKVKRIRNNPEVTLQPCDMRGNVKAGTDLALLARTVPRVLRRKGAA